MSHYEKRVTLYEETGKRQYIRDLYACKVFAHYETSSRDNREVDLFEISASAVRYERSRENRTAVRGASEQLD